MRRLGLIDTAAVEFDEAFAAQGRSKLFSDPIRSDPNSPSFCLAYFFGADSRKIRRI
jgi:hypothetical protein